MKRLLTLVLLLSLNYGFAQDQIDSLETALFSMEQDSSKVNALLKIAVQYMGKNVDSMKSLSQQAHDISRQIEYPSGEARALLLIGINYRRQGDMLQGLANCRKALQISIDFDLKEIQADALNNIGLIYNYQGDYPLALETYQKALVIGEINNYEPLIAKSLLYIGGIHYNMKDYERALKYWENALQLQLRKGDNRSVASTMNNIGIVYLDKGDYKKALNYYLKSLELYDVKDACLRIYPLGNIGDIYIKTGQLDSAEFYLKQAYDQSVVCKDPIIQMASLTSISEVYQKQNHIEEAFNNLERAIEIGEKSGLKRETSLAIKSLSQLYEQTGQAIKAFMYFKLFYELQDSLVNEEKSKSVGSLEASYAYEKTKREDEIKARIIALENEREQTRERWVRNSSIAGFIIMIAVAMLIFRGYKRKKESNLRLFQLYEEIKEQQHELASQADQLHSLNNSLSELNGNLELKISQRTKELSERNAELKIKNTKLAEYAFTNSHKLRAPVASILGLVKLFDNEEVDNEEKNHIIAKIAHSTEKLNSIVKEIREALEKDDFVD